MDEGIVILVAVLIAGMFFGYMLGSDFKEREMIDHCKNGTTFMVGDIKHECKRVVE